MFYVGQRVWLVQYGVHGVVVAVFPGEGYEDAEVRCPDDGQRKGKQHVVLVPFVDMVAA
jgi:hypothetical protein